MAKVLEQKHRGLTTELVPLVSRGDKILDVALNKVGGKGLFVKELERALLENRADIAVHSMKDVPMAFPEGLHLPVIGEREDPRDAFVSNTFSELAALPHNARVGTSSLRRQSQLLAARPDLKIHFLRGNVNTRLAKLDSGEFDAIILASAGLKRLGFSDRITQPLDTHMCLPAAGQGALGIESRVDDEELTTLIRSLNHTNTHNCLLAERAVVRRLDGGCQVPIAAYATIKDGQLSIEARVASVDGKIMIKATDTGAAGDADSIGTRAGERLLAQGADVILANLQQT